MAADSGGYNEPLQLEPFVHQVGGHSSMLQLDENTICKPLIPQELNFYKTAPDCLKQFMAEYKGVIEVTFSEAVDGYLDLTAYLPPNYKTSSSKPGSRQNSLTENEHKSKHRIRLCQSGNIQIDSIAVDDKKQSYEECSQGKSQNGSLNPWVLHCHQEQMKKLRKSSSIVSQKYILLENRVSKYEIPCILDIKMGTRQYGDNASLSKRQSHTAKAAASTSSSLGVRLSGMVVYRHDSGRYICHNKYYGHSLTVDGFHQALFNFLYDGHRLCYKVITALIEKLRKLYSVVQGLNTFRFFTSSLLIIYDAKDSYYKNGLSDENNITLQFSDNCNLAKQESSQHFSSQCDKCSASSDSSVCRNHLTDQSAGDSECLLPIVDICMIDFAHSTHSQMPDSVVSHVGPDEGYLFGLENLIAHLEIILQTGK